MTPLSPWVRRAALVGWLACLVTLLVWFGMDGTGAGPWIAGALALPLLPALPGLWRGRRYTYGWLSLLLLGYMTLGLTETFANPADRGPALAHLLAVVWLFTCCLLFARLQSRESAPSPSPDPATSEPAES